MANINLDIKANTQKALGEFKKLSRELDNKFLVQGLKLDVVKSAFRDIERQFQNSLGESGLKAAENSAQLQRSLALNLVTFRRFNNDVAGEVAKSVRSSLSSLAAQGKITQDTLKETLNLATFFDFEGTDAQRKKAFASFASDFAQLNQNLRRAYGQEAGQLFNKVLTGQFTQDELFQLEQRGGAVGNRIRQLLRDQRLSSGLQSRDPIERTRVANELRRALENSPEYKEAVAEIRRTQPLTILRDEIAGLFDPNEGVFGSLREVAGTGTNILTETAKLLRSIFDPKEGLFARVAQLLGQTFGISDPLEPIIRAVQFITRTVEGLTKGTGSIESFITSIFDALRGFFDRVKQFIDNIDADQLGSFVKTIIDEIIKTLPSLIGALFSAVGKAFQTLNAAGLTPLLGAGAGLFGLNAATNLITRRRGGVLGAVGRNLDRRIRQGVGGLLRPGRERRAAQRRAGTRSRRGRILDFIVGAEAGTVDYSSGNPDLARGGGFTGWEGEVIRKFNQIIIILRDAVPVYMTRPRFNPGGGGFTIGSGGNPGGPYGPFPDSGVARADNFLDRQFRRSSIMARRQSSLMRRGIRDLPGRFGGFAGRAGRGIGNIGLGALAFALGEDPALSQMASDYEFAGTNYMAPIGPLPLGSSEPYAENMAGGYDPRMISDLTPDMRNEQIMRRYDRRMAYRRSFRGRMGQLGRGMRGLGRLGGPLAGGLLTAFSIASLFGGSANASEMDGMDEEDRRSQRRERDRAVIGGLAGMAGGAAGGALLGSAFGPVGTLIGGTIGAFVGEEAVKALSDPIIDGIGDFARSIGDWFGNLWEGTKNLFGAAGKGIADFFGERGPIQSIWRFLMDIPNKVQEFVSSGWDFLSGALKNVPKGLLYAALGPLAGGAAFVIDKLQGRALGGAGRGLTLVGENGPEFVDFGTGSVAYPSSSFSGVSRSGRGSGGPISIVINVNAPGANEFANQLTDQVINELNRQFELNEENA